MNTVSNPAITWRRYGPCGLIFSFSDHPGDGVFEHLQSISRALDIAPPEGLVDYFRGFTTLTLEFSEVLPENIEPLANELLRTWDGATPCTTLPRRFDIPIIYDGPDLSRVAAHSGLSPEEVCSVYQSTTYRVHMLGFCPGFPYLHGLDSRLHTPRLDTPRAQVAAGAVAIGGGHTGIYPVNRPGGWNIIGHTSERLFNPENTRENSPENAFLLRPGDLIRFVPHP